MAPHEIEDRAVEAEDVVKRRIVVADDNIDCAESTAVILRMEGHTVHVAYDGEHTVELVASVRPEVVLLDIGLPKLNGYDAARRIRAMDDMKDVLLVAITGWGQQKDRQLAQEAGFDRHLVKPVDPDVLIQLVAQYVPHETGDRRVNNLANGTGVSDRSSPPSAAYAARGSDKL